MLRTFEVAYRRPPNTHAEGLSKLIPQYTWLHRATALPRKNHGTEEQKQAVRPNVAQPFS